MLAVLAAIQAQIEGDELDAGKNIKVRKIKYFLLIKKDQTK